MCVARTLIDLPTFAGVNNQHEETMKRFILAVIAIACTTLFANAQVKGELGYLDKRCGIYPVMLNDSIIKHLTVLDLIGKVEKGNALCLLSEDYCVLNTANLKRVRVKFVDYTARNILFYVEPAFIDACLSELVGLYGEAQSDGEKYIWEAGKTVLIYDKKPKDAPGLAVGVFFRREDLAK